MGLFKSGKQQPSTNLSIVAQSCKVLGDIELEGDIQIDGYGEGRILNARSVVISATGRYKGKINAASITINGLVEGECEAKCIDILSQGKMKGILSTEQLTIDKGGLLVGENRAPEHEPALTVVNNKEKNQEKSSASSKKVAAKQG